MGSHQTYWECFECGDRMPWMEGYDDCGTCGEPWDDFDLDTKSSGYCNWVWECLNCDSYVDWPKSECLICGAKWDKALRKQNGAPTYSKPPYNEPDPEEVEDYKDEADYEEKKKQPASKHTPGCPEDCPGPHTTDDKACQCEGCPHKREPGERKRSYNKDGDPSRRMRFSEVAGDYLPYDTESHLVKAWIFYDFPIGSAGITKEKLSGWTAFNAMKKATFTDRLEPPVWHRVDDHGQNVEVEGRRRFYVIGASDCFGSEAINGPLRKARVQKLHTMWEYLASYSIPRSELSEGEKAAIDRLRYPATNASEEGRRKNRSVVLFEVLREVKPTDPDVEIPSDPGGGDAPWDEDPAYWTFERKLTTTLKFGGDASAAALTAFMGGTAPIATATGITLGGGYLLAGFGWLAGFGALIYGEFAALAHALSAGERVQAALGRSYGAVDAAINVGIALDGGYDSRPWTNSGDPHYREGYKVGYDAMEEWAASEQDGRKFAAIVKALYKISYQAAPKHQKRAKAELGRITTRIFHEMCDQEGVKIFKDYYLTWPTGGPHEKKK